MRNGGYDCTFACLCFSFQTNILTSCRVCTAKIVYTHTHSLYLVVVQCDGLVLWIDDDGSHNEQVTGFRTLASAYTMRIFGDHI